MCFAFERIVVLALGAILAGCTVGGAMSPKGSAEVAGPLRVAVYEGAGARSCGAFHHLEMLTRAEGVEAFPVDAEMIRAGALDDADVLVMPGGKARLELATLGEDGGERIREFVRRGGGYVGTCAGAYLISQPVPGFMNRLGLIPFVGGPAQPDDCNMKIAFTEKWAKELELPKRAWNVNYAGGPRFTPSEPVEGAVAEIAAPYVSDVNAMDEKPRPSFLGKGAVVIGTYGRGRIFASAVHPEKHAENRALLHAAYRYVSGRTIVWKAPVRKSGQLNVGIITDASLGVATARFLQDVIRTDEFRLTPLNADAIAFNGYGQFDALLVPPEARGEPRKAAFGKNEPLTRAFLARGGRIFVWGESSEIYAGLGAGVTCVKDGEAAVAALRALAAEPPDTGTRPWTELTKEEHPVRALFFYDRGGMSNLGVAEALSLSSAFDVRIVTGREIAEGALDEADFLLMPGGSCNAEYHTLGEAGVAAVTNFVRRGGSYYGICAGAFLATQTAKPNLPRMGMVPFRHDNSAYRGRTRTRLGFTDEGKRVYGRDEDYRTVFYGGGPVMIPGAEVPDTDVKVLAEYAAALIQTSSTNAVLPLAGKAAILAGRVGRGRVFVQGPHPETDKCTFDMILSGVRYLTGREARPATRHHLRGAPEVGCAVRNAGDANLYIGSLIRMPGVNVRKATPDESYSQSLVDLAVLVIPSPSKNDNTVGLKRLVKSGRTVIVVARTEEERALVADWRGVRVVGSHEEAVAAVEKALGR